MLPPELEAKFPKLRADGAKKTSDPDSQYNCIAWSAKRDKKHWWQPVKEEPWDYWPPDCPDDEQDFQTFVALFEKMGFKKCVGAQFEFFYKRVALFSTPGWGFSHVCDQLNSGAWTSKLAKDEDIQHNSLECLEGSLTNEYGEVKQILKKPCTPWDILARAFFKIVRLL
jgi:hypothetical protein